ncbi:MAG: hypothetical protein DI598_14230 [Pseudopedobacter saltans]|uniref:Glycosyl transferase family 1 domain-containing protein n=1 Tax=Pseudopedobacter saltans TaxID=151895 RepID=A0A2W5ERS0_9SPHI|nr:MAG: hypothetical protein DI598_14230 [Pseudopedobacter saltans]
MSSNIVFVDSTTEYPYRFSAGNTKVELLAKGLIPHGNKITAINSPLIGENVVDEYTVSDYLDIECHSFQKKKTIGSIFKNFRTLYKVLKVKSKQNKDNVLIISDPQYFLIFLLEIFFAKVLKYKVVRLLHEWHSSVKNVSKKQKLGFYLLDNYFGYFCDAILPISHFLEDRSVKYKKPMMLVPILAEYPENSIDNVRPAEQYFVYCVGAQYFHVINRLLQHLNTMNQDYPTVSLVLVLYGEKKFINIIQNQIGKLGLEPKVTIKSKLPQEELYKLFRGALGLIIPLEDSIQDKARFSQKIAEYISCKRPIITNKIGEIPYYFEDKVNAVFAAPIESDDFVFSLKYLANNPEKATDIGLMGFEVGVKYFNYKTVGNNLDKFLSAIKK